MTWITVVWLLGILPFPAWITWILVRNWRWRAAYRKSPYQIGYRGIMRGTLIEHWEVGRFVWRGPAIFVAWHRARGSDAGALDSEALRTVHAIVQAPGGLRSTPTQLAAAVGMHSTVFARKFRRATGDSPRALLAKRRIEAVAERLLSDPRPVAAVAADVGWADPGLFSRRFSRVMGMAPGAWRRERQA